MLVLGGADETLSMKMSIGEAEGPSDEEVEDDGAAAGDKLVEVIGNLSQDNDAPRLRQAEFTRPENEFHAGSMGDEVTMDDLLQPLAQAPKFGDVRRQLEKLANMEPALEPMSEAKKTREERKTEFERASKDIKKWIPQIQRNRQSDQVVLTETPKLDNEDVAGLIADAAPVDDFERELAAVTKAAGGTEEEMKGAKLLPMNPKIRNEEQRRAVARLKAMITREHQTSKRVNKIKSKAYRRIHRRAEQRDKEVLLERVENENPELAQALRAEFEKKHAAIRMLRNRNARRKWATTMKRFAKGDKDAQREVSKQAQEAHDEERGLRRAIRGRNPDQSDDSEAADLSGTDSEEEATGERRSVAQSTLSMAQRKTVKELKELEKGGELPTTGLLGMGFMRNAIAEKREKAKQEAKSVLKELEGMEGRLDAARHAGDSDGESQDEEAGGLAVKGIAKVAPAAAVENNRTKQFTPEELAAARQEVDAMFEQEDGPMQCSVSAPLTVKGVAAAVQAPPQRKKKRAAPGLPEKSDVQQAENPWLDVLPDGDASLEGQECAEAATAAEAEPRKKTRPKKRKVTATAGKVPEAMQVDDDVLNVLNADSAAAQEQRDLVRTAFIEGTQEEDWEREQEEHARKLEEDKAEKSCELPGWGSWTGEGTTPKKPKKQAPSKPVLKIDRNPARVNEEHGMAKTGKYFLQKVPLGYSNPQQYEQELRMPLGQEWNTKSVHQNRIKPKVFVKVGAVVPPLQYVKHLPAKEQEDIVDTYAKGKLTKRLKARF